MPESTLSNGAPRACAWHLLNDPSSLQNFRVGASPGSSAQHVWRNPPKPYHRFRLPPRACPWSPAKADEENFLLLCSQLNPAGDAEQQIRGLIKTPLDWDMIMRTAGRQGVSLCLYNTLTKLGLQSSCPQDVYGRLKSTFYTSVNRMTRLEREMFRVQDAASEEQIGIIPFKGLSLAHTVYPNPALRAMDDIDILVREDQFNEFVTLLNQMGYTPPAEELDPLNPTAPLCKKLSENFNMPIDVHRALTPDRPNKIRLPLWERAREISVENRKISVLSPEDTFLSLALHLRRHLRRLTLKFVVDIAQLLNTNGAGLDWGYIKESSKSNHICRTVYLALYLSRELLNAPVPEKIYKEFDPAAFTQSLIRRALNRRNIFRLKKQNGTLLRLLLFDRPSDLALYVWRVSFLERRLKRTAFARKSPASITSPAVRKTKR